MQRLWSPWRAKYISSFSEKKKSRPRRGSVLSAKKSALGGCIFCKASRQGRDDENFIVWRGRLCFIILNLFPYNSGHLMVVPYKHTFSFGDLSDEEYLEVMKTTKLAIEVLQRTFHPDGFNTGANLGRVSGAGIDQHVHFHVVPRWNGDTNFMPILGNTKVISEDMRVTLKKLRKALHYGGRVRLRSE